MPRAASRQKCRRSSTATISCVSIWRRRCSPSAIRSPASCSKREYGPWVFGAFRLLAKLRGLRGTALDVFGRTEERRIERQLITEYETVMREMLGKLTAANHALAVQIASIPEDIRGYGHVKMRNLAAAKDKQARLLGEFRSPAPARVAA